MENDESRGCSHEAYTPLFLQEKSKRPKTDIVLVEWDDATNKMLVQRSEMRGKWNLFLDRVSPDQAEGCKEEIIVALSWVLDKCAPFCNKIPKLYLSRLPRAEISDVKRVLNDMAPGTLYYYLQLCPRNFDLQQLLLHSDPRMDETDYVRSAATANSLLNLLTVCAKVSPKALWRHFVINNKKVNHWYYWMAYVLVDLGIFCPNLCSEMLEDADVECEELMKQVLETVSTRPLSLMQLSRLTIRNNMRDVHVLKDCYKLPLTQKLQNYASLEFLNASICSWYLGKVQGHFCYSAVKRLCERYNITPMPCECGGSQLY